MKKSIHMIILMILILLVATGGLRADETQKEEMFAAMREGDIVAMEQLLNDGLDVNEKFIVAGYEVTFVYFAVTVGHYDAVEWLLDNGADVNLRCNDSTPLAVLENCMKPFASHRVFDSEEERERYEQLITEQQVTYTQIKELLLSRGAISDYVWSETRFKELRGDIQIPTNFLAFDAERMAVIYCDADKIDVKFREEEASFSLSQVTELPQWLKDRTQPFDGVQVKIFSGGAEAFRLVKDDIYELNVLGIELCVEREDE